MSIILYLKLVISTNEQISNKRQLSTEDNEEICFKRPRIRKESNITQTFSPNFPISPAPSDSDSEVSNISDISAIFVSSFNFTDDYRQNFGIKPCKMCCLLLEFKNKYGPMEDIFKYNYCKSTLKNKDFCESCVGIFQEFNFFKSINCHNEKMGNICHYSCFCIDIFSFLVNYQQLPSKIEQLRFFCDRFVSINLYSNTIQNLNTYLNKKLNLPFDPSNRNIGKYRDIYIADNRLKSIIEMNCDAIKINNLIQVLRKELDSFKAFLNLNIFFTSIENPDTDDILYGVCFNDEFLDIEQLLTCLNDLTNLKIFTYINAVTLRTYNTSDITYTNILLNLIQLEYLYIKISEDIPIPISNEPLIYNFQPNTQLKVLKLLIYENKPHIDKLLNILALYTDTLFITTLSTLQIDNECGSHLQSFIINSSCTNLVFKHVTILFLLKFFRNFLQSDKNIEDLSIYDSETVFASAIILIHCKKYNDISPENNNKKRNKSNNKKPLNNFKISIPSNVRCTNFFGLLNIFSSFDVQQDLVIDIYNTGPHVKRRDLIHACNGDQAPLSNLFNRIASINNLILRLGAPINLDVLEDCAYAMLCNLLIFSRSCYLIMSSFPKKLCSMNGVFANLSFVSFAIGDISWPDFIRFLLRCPRITTIRLVNCIFDCLSNLHVAELPVLNTNSDIDINTNSDTDSNIDRNVDGNTNRDINNDRDTNNDSDISDYKARLPQLEIIIDGLEYEDFIAVLVALDTNIKKLVISNISNEIDTSFDEIITDRISIESVVIRWSTTSENIEMLKRFVGRRTRTAKVEIQIND